MDVDWWDNVTDTWELSSNESTLISNSSTENGTSQGCPDRAKVPDMFLHGTVAIAFCIIFMFSFLEKRTQKYLDCCGGKPGLVVPINLLDDYENRWAYAFAFGAVTNTVVVIFQDGPTLNFEGRLITKVLVGLLTFIEICVNLYPFFACLNTSHKIIGNITGFLYASLWLGVLIYFTVECVDPTPEVLPYFGLVLEFPTLLCLAFLVVWYAVYLGLAIYRTCTGKHKVKDTTPVIACTWQLDYVHKLFLRRKEISDQADQKLTFCQKMKKWVSDNLYEYKVPFKYSSRIFCSLFVVFMCTYQLGLAYFWMNGQVINWFHLEVNGLLDLINVPSNSSSVDNIRVSTRILNIGWGLVAGLTLVLFVLDVLVVFVKYRSHMLMLFRGDRRFLPSDINTESAELMRCCMLYCGFQVGYMIWGFFVMIIVMLVLMLIAGFIIVLPAMNGYYDIIISIAEVMVIPVVLDFGLRYIQQVMATAFFLQPKINKDDRQKPLAVNNRKLFHIMNYFFFFSNIATGLFSCLLRILKTLAFGLIYLGRLDMCVLMGGRESFDIGHNAYLGMVHIEAAHNNPTLRTFCQILYNQQGDCKTDTVTEPVNEDPTDDPKEVKVDDMHERISLTQYPDDGPSSPPVPSGTTSARSRRRWHLLYTLLHNPHLIPQRRFDIACKFQAAERKIDINVVIAKKQRYKKLKQELDDLEREITGDNEIIARENQKSSAFTICKNLVGMEVSVDPSETAGKAEANGLTKKAVIDGQSMDSSIVENDKFGDGVTEENTGGKNLSQLDMATQKDQNVTHSKTDDDKVETTNTDEPGKLADSKNLDSPPEKSNRLSSDSPQSVVCEVERGSSSQMPSKATLIEVAPSDGTGTTTRGQELTETKADNTADTQDANQQPSPPEVIVRSDTAIDTTMTSEKL